MVKKETGSRIRRLKKKNRKEGDAPKGRLVCLNHEGKNSPFGDASLLFPGRREVYIDLYRDGKKEGGPSFSSLKKVMFPGTREKGGRGHRRASLVEGIREETLLPLLDWHLFPGKKKEG